MAAAKGNKYSKGLKNGEKLKTDELKKMAYEQYCAHIAKGKAKKSWYFEHPELIMSWKTMEKYMADNESLLNPIHMETSWSKGYQRWEGVVEDSASGVNKEANTASLQMLMRNKFNWDKENSVQKDTHEPLIKRIAKKWRGEDDRSND